ncbi:MAG TPA: phosphatase PAP2 family protein [Xanthobacteraceae bacterium]|nr:phosphatase PAP2 family protein [Xanthobacteraceae bacterium]
MNRTGLVLALVVAIVVGVLFGVYPRLDLAISAFFYDPHSGLFRVNVQPWVLHSRDGARYLVALIAAPAFLAIVGKLLLPHRRMLVRGRAALFLILTLALGPGVLTNVILKDNWPRARPIDVKELGGTDRFTPWWDPRGDCPANCSFIAGEPSGAFWTLAAAALAPPQWRMAAYAGALTFGAAVGALRIAAGGHFFTDVAFAGVLTFLLIWLLHGLIFRWPATRLSDDAAERPLVKAGEALRGVFAAIVPRRSGKTGKLS